MRKKKKNRKALKTYALNLLLILAFGLSAQEVVNEELIKGSNKLYIKPSTKRYVQFTETKSGIVIFQSHLTRNIHYITYNGKEQLAIVQIYKSNGYIDRDSSLCDKQTLKPLAYYSDLVSEGYKEIVFFEGTKIENKTFYKDSLKTTVQINNGKFNGVITDELVASLPFKQDGFYKIQVVNPGLLYSEYNITVRVLGKEDLEIPGIGKIPCWKINVNSGVGNGAMEWRTVNDHTQIKKTFDLPDGSCFKRILLNE